jgi:uncharacterized membrane-anchored protein
VKPNKAWFWLAVAFQVLILLGIVGRHAYTIATGHPIMLKPAPRDPWDVIRGEYVSLSYNISGLNPSEVPMEGTPYKPGQPVWVTLREGKPFWTAVAVSNKRPITKPADLAAQAIVEWYITSAPVVRQPRLPTLRLRYGIEQFYVPEGEGPDLERRWADMTVEAVVDRFGRAALHRVFLEGKEIRWH